MVVGSGADKSELDEWGGRGLGRLEDVLADGRFQGGVEGEEFAGCWSSRYDAGGAVDLSGGGGACCGVGARRCCSVRVGAGGGGVGILVLC